MDMMCSAKSSTYRLLLHRRNLTSGWTPSFVHLHGHDALCKNLSYHLLLHRSNLTSNSTPPFVHLHGHAVLCQKVELPFAAAF
jgi:hypothetical protein